MGDTNTCTLYITAFVYGFTDYVYGLVTGLFAWISLTFFVSGLILLFRNITFIPLCEIPCGF